MVDKNFFTRDAEVVAKELLGKVLVKKVNGKILKAKIIETEAYYDKKDPASRACQNGDLKKTMESGAGTILVYGVHNNWLINFVTGKKGKEEAVLLRALEPLNFNKKCNGPGLLTKAFLIDKTLHKKTLGKEAGNELWIENIKSKPFQIKNSFRIGVKKDLPKKLRFYIKNNPHISRK